MSASMLSDDALLERVRILAARERSCTVELVAHLAALDARSACLGTGRSLYRYCTDVLGLSEHAAYNRIGAARAARRFPAILDLLADGSVNVSTVTLLAPHLTDENHRSLLHDATRKTKEEVKEIVRRLDPEPAARTVVRAVPVTTPSRGSSAESTTQAPAPRSPVGIGGADDATPVSCQSGAVAPRIVVPPIEAKSSLEPRAPDRYRMHVDVDLETRDGIRRLQDLLARETGGDVSRIIGKAVKLLLKDVEREKLGATARPRSRRQPKEGSRHISAAVRREVWRRDAGRCAFVGSSGRCPESRYLEWHHVIPHAHQGPPTVENIALRCRAHNAY